MSLESAIDIFTKQGFSNPQWAVDTIKKARSLYELKQIMIEHKTYLSPDQFVHFRITSLFEGDPEFARMTLESAKKKFSEHGVPQEIVVCYISKGGSADISIGMDIEMYLGRLPKVEDRSKLLAFYDDAQKYLFEALRNYVVDNSL